MSDNIATAYQEIAEYIEAKEGKCVLILGPGLSVYRQRTSYKSCFREIAFHKNTGIVTYFENENLFAFNYYDDYIRKGDSIKNKGNKAAFEAAINAYNTAMLHCPEKAIQTESFFKKRSVIESFLL